MDGNSVKKSDIFSKLKDKNLIVSNGYINGSFTSGEAKKTFDVKDILKSLWDRWNHYGVNFGVNSS